MTLVLIINSLIDLQSPIQWHLTEVSEKKFAFVFWFNATYESDLGLILNKKWFPRSDL